jgi:maleamate amidohydrolase
MADKQEVTMSERIWSRFLTERDKQVFETAGYAASAGFGKRPALLVIDVSYAFCGDRREPILDAIKRWRNACGEDAWDALPILRRLIDAARDREVPVIYTTGAGRADKWDSGSWAWKSSAGKIVSGTNLDGNEIMPQIAPGPRDIVVKKQKPSAFYGTPLLGYLMMLQCDSLIVAGTTTSGCVRASVIDAFSNNIRCSVIEDACFDRSQASHALSLCDMNAKYADVIESDEALAYLQGLSKGLFKLPSGEGMTSAF